MTELTNAHRLAMARKSSTAHNARAGGLDKSKPTNAAPRGPKLFIAVIGAALTEHDVKPGEVAIEGAKILKTHAHLFRPLEITYKA